MKVLIVHAHHEPQSFCSALSNRARTELLQNGHEVLFSDLHAMDFDPVSDRRNFKTVKDPNYLKQQHEEMYASEHSGFATDIENEIRKLEECDALIFTFPLWWFGMPAILKGWCDRVLAMGRVYGGGKFYEDGLGESKKRALIVTTTGGGANGYDGWGLNPSMHSVMQPIQHGIFWFNGFLPLEPFVAWSPVRISEGERKQYLEQLAKKIHGLFEEPPIAMPPMKEFPNWGPDSKNRYQVVIRRTSPVDDKYKSLIPAEVHAIKELRRKGVLLDFEMGTPQDTDWRAFLKIRASDENEVRQHLQQLPLAPYLQFDITKLVQPVAAEELLATK